MTDSQRPRLVPPQEEFLAHAGMPALALSGLMPGASACPAIGVHPVRPVATWVESSEDGARPAGTHAVVSVARAEHMQEIWERLFEQYGEGVVPRWDSIQRREPLHCTRH